MPRGGYNIVLSGNGFFGPNHEKDIPMKNVHRAKLVVLLSLVGLFVVGCWDRDKERIRMLLIDKQVALQQKEELASKLVKSEEEQAELHILLDGRDAQRGIDQAKITTLEADLAAALAKKPIRDDGGTDRPVDRGRTWTVGGDVLFASGQATLSADGRRELNRVIDSINRDYPGSSIRVYGHTDSTKIVKSKWKDNMELSEARAEEVRRYMVARGIRAQNIRTIGMGATNPVASNSTSTGRRRNRRVEITVVRK